MSNQKSLIKKQKSFIVEQIYTLENKALIKDVNLYFRLGI